MFRKFGVIILILFLFEGCVCYADYSDYLLKVRQREQKEKYEKQNMPKSGYQTIEEYEQKSRAKDKSKGDGEFIAPPPKDSEMKYVPQPKYKIVRYNDPPGSHEINLQRKVRYDRQEIIPGVIASDFSIMVFPIVSYYAKTNSTDCDVYILPLNKRLPDIEKVIKANIGAKFPNPIFATDRTLIEDGTFRSITPIDFSPNLLKIIAKEKTGNVFDGIWKTDLLVYDFKTRETKKIVEIREAIRYYWLMHDELDLKEVRWDIYPLGFQANSSERILVNAFAYTGKKPRFLGTWSVDCQGKQSRLISMNPHNTAVSIVGFEIKEDGVIDPASIIADEKRAKAAEKDLTKEKKQEKKLLKKERKDEYKKIIKTMKQETKAYKKEQKNSLEKHSVKIEGNLFTKIRFHSGTPTSFGQ